MTTDLSRCENGDITYRMSREERKHTISKDERQDEEHLGRDEELADSSQTSAEADRVLLVFLEENHGIFIAFLSRNESGGLQEVKDDRTDNEDDYK